MISFLSWPSSGWTKEDKSGKEETRLTKYKESGPRTDCVCHASLTILNYKVIWTLQRFCADARKFPRARIISKVLYQLWKHKYAFDSISRTCWFNTSTDSLLLHDLSSKNIAYFNGNSFWLWTLSRFGQRELVFKVRCHGLYCTTVWQDCSPEHKTMLNITCVHYIFLIFLSGTTEVISTLEDWNKCPVSLNTHASSYFPLWILFIFTLSYAVLSYLI